MRTSCLVHLVTAALFLGAGPTLAAPDAADIEVDSVAALYAALEKAASGARVRLRPGIYVLERPLDVPDGVTVEGAGRMDLDPNGRAQEFAASVTLRIPPDLRGDALRPGDGSVLRRLRIEETVGTTAGEAATAKRLGNLVAIASRHPNDRVRVTIVECELIDTNHAWFDQMGPTGRTIAIVTRPATPDGSEAAHDSSQLEVAIERTIVRSRHGGNSVFANNFAAQSRIVVALRDNRIEGMLGIVGGTSRRGTVYGSTSVLHSSGNLYRQPAESSLPGWALSGASSSPHAETATPETRGNRLEVRSSGDRIEGFETGIVASGGRRTPGPVGLVSGNRAEVSIEDMEISSRATGADLRLQGALADGGRDASSEFPVGADNELAVTLNRVRGSGARANVYAHVTGPVLPANQLPGNRLSIAPAGSAFAIANPSILPPPPFPEFAGDEPGENVSLLRDGTAPAKLACRTR
jgi:hypothetical protein